MALNAWNPLRYFSKRYIIVTCIICIFLFISAQKWIGKYTNYDNFHKMTRIFMSNGTEDLHGIASGGNIPTGNITNLIHSTTKRNLSKFSKNMAPKIPHILHQTWDSHMVPNVFKNWVLSWVYMHPDWEYWFWTPKEVTQLIAKYYPEYLTMYKNYPQMIKKSDAMRYFIMEKYGGVYVDLDMECLKNIDEWTYKYNCFLSEETYEHPFLLYNRQRSEVMTTILACKPNHPFYNLTIRRLPASASKGDVLQATGPFFLDASYMVYNRSKQKEEDMVKVISPDYFLPTYDKIHTSRFNDYCSRIEPRMRQKQRWICEEMKKRGYQNKPRPISYANHHWYHVNMKSPTWKRKTPSFDIKSVVPKLIVPII